MRLIKRVSQKGHPLFIHSGVDIKMRVRKLLYISMAKPVFKKYEQQQTFLLPPSLDDLIEANHPVRIETNNNVRVVVDGTGNVGIGSTSPQQKIDISGAIYQGMGVTTTTAAMRTFGNRAGS